MIKNITGSDLTFLDSFKNSKIDFILAMSLTETYQIDGITQAGIKNFIHLTPTLDAEYLATKSLFSIDNLPSTPSGIPTPAVITRACYELIDFNLNFLDLGLTVLPKNIEFKSFGISPSSRIDNGAKIDSKAIFQKGVDFAKDYKSTHIFLSESIPAGTTTAEATARALGYSVDGFYASSFRDKPKDIKEQTIKSALSLIDDSMNPFERLSIVSDNMLIFYAGFVSEVSKKAKVVLAGGTQLATVLLILDSLKVDFNHKNVALATTKWIAEDTNSDIKALLNLLDFEIDSFYSDFSFVDSSIDVLKLYDKGEAKEGVGAGGSLVLANLKGFSNSEILERIEGNLR